MKKILLLILISFNCYSQDAAENFTVENNQIIWIKIYNLSDTESIDNLKNNLSLKFSDPNFGTAENLELRCDDIAIYSKETFKLNFKIEKKDNRYRVIVSNIVFNNSINLNFGTVSTDEKFNTIESMELRNSDNTLRKNKQSLRNRNCLNEYLTELFKIKKSKDW